MQVDNFADITEELTDVRQQWAADTARYEALLEGADGYGLFQIRVLCSEPNFCDGLLEGSKTFEGMTVTLSFPEGCDQDVFALHAYKFITDSGEAA